MTRRETAGQWRYSLRWRYPHRPCPGKVELVSALVPAGAPAPAAVLEQWTPGGDYMVCVGYPPPAPIKRWSAERKAACRRRNMEKRIRKVAPLFADELIAQELEKRPDYFAGK